MAQRISIGFHASPPLAARVSDEQLAALRDALTGGADGWHELDSEDGCITLKLSQVLFVRTEKDEQRIGFGLNG